jgi:hypothetical protein
MSKPAAAPPTWRSSLCLAICIFVLSFTIYMLAYSGFPHTTDEMAMVAASQAFSRHGRLTANPFIWNPYGVVNRVGETSTKINFEPAQSILGAALHLAADRFPRLGNVHTVLLLNVIVTALTVALVFLYVRELGYAAATAMATAAVYGAATIALPFAKTFFREPLSALSLLLAAYGLLRLARRGQLAWSIVIALGLGLAALTKASNLFSLAAFVPIAPFYLRDYLRHERRRRLNPAIRSALIALSLALALALFYMIIRDDTFARIARALQERLLRPIWPEGQISALYGFLFSPGKSVFIYTPVFLACFVSLPWFWREHRREAILCSAMALAFLLGYAYADPTVWWSGLGWGPRFLVPVAPFLGIILAPLLARLLKRPTAPASWPFYILLLASLLVQAVGAAFGIEFYSDEISKIDPAGMWGIALHDIRYSAPIFLLRYIRLANFDFAWAHAWGGEAQVDWPVLLACAAVAALAVAALWRCRERPPNGWLLAAGGFVLTLGLAFFSLSRYYDDPRYLGGPDYHALTDYLAQAAAPEDAIVVTNHIYTNFFLNYTKGRTEWYAERREHRPISDNLLVMLDGFLKEHPRLWLVLDNSPLPAHADLPKAAEAWTTQNAFKLDEKIFGEYCRVASFDGTHYPLPETPPQPLQASLGGQIALQGYYRPADERPAPGGLVRLALYWQTQRRLTEDYHVTVQFLDEQGALHWQTDRVPGEGFWPTYFWEPGRPVRDLYTLHLPEDLPPGKYRVIAALYDWRSGERLPANGQDASADYVTVTQLSINN